MPCLVVVDFVQRQVVGAVYTHFLILLVGHSEVASEDRQILVGIVPVPVLEVVDFQVDFQREIEHLVGR